MTSDETVDGLLDRVRAVVPLVAERADAAEAARKPDDEVIAALRQTGVFRSYVPRRFGGYEIDTDTFIDIGLAVSEACASTGWVTMFYLEHNWMLAQFPPQTQEAVFGARGYILAPASISPTGRAEVVDGGDAYRLGGRWAWGTGVMHADWALLNGVVAGDHPDVRLFLVPIDEVMVDDTWYSSGMVATGSNDMVVAELDVPAARSARLADMAAGRGEGARWHDSPTYRHPMLPLLSIAAATPALGVARRAVELFAERLSTRSLYGTFAPQAERASAQMRLANASVTVDAAERLLRGVGHDTTVWGGRDEICPPVERARLRLQVAHVVRMCRQVVRDVMEASGAGAHLLSHQMQRLHRDVHTISCHTVFDVDLGAENYGRVLLGMDPVSPV